MTVSVLKIRFLPLEKAKKSKSEQVRCVNLAQQKQFDSSSNMRSAKATITATDTIEVIRNRNDCPTYKLIEFVPQAYSCRRIRGIFVFASSENI